MGPKWSILNGGLRRANGGSPGARRQPMITAQTSRPGAQVPGVCCGLMNAAQPLDQSSLVHRANLIEHDMSGFSLKLDRDAGRIGPSLSGHGSHDHRLDVAVHLVRRDDESGTGLADFVATGGVESNDGVLKP